MAGQGAAVHSARILFARSPVPRAAAPELCYNKGYDRSRMDSLPFVLFILLVKGMFFP